MINEIVGCESGFIVLMVAVVCLSVIAFWGIIPIIKHIIHLIKKEEAG